MKSVILLIALTATLAHAAPVSWSELNGAASNADLLVIRESESESMSIRLSCVDQGRANAQWNRPAELLEQVCLANQIQSYSDMTLAIYASVEARLGRQPNSPAKRAEITALAENKRWVIGLRNEAVKRGQELSRRFTASRQSTSEIDVAVAFYHIAQLRRTELFEVYR